MRVCITGSCGDMGGGGVGTTQHQGGENADRVVSRTRSHTTEQRLVPIGRTRTGVRGPLSDVNHERTRAAISKIWRLNGPKYTEMNREEEGTNKFEVKQA